MQEVDTKTTLRETILSLTYQCPKRAYTADCPFNILRGLSHESRRNTLGQMHGEDLLRLFDLAEDCGCPADPRSPDSPLPEPS